MPKGASQYKNHKDRQPNDKTNTIEKQNKTNRKDESEAAGKKQEAPIGKEPMPHKVHRLETEKSQPARGKPRKTLAPFKTINQDITLRRTQELQCQEADHAIAEALKADRDAKFARMGTWKITKKISRNGAVCVKTQATDKLAYLLGKIKDPTNKLAFFEKQNNLRKIYLEKIRHRRRTELTNKAKLHPVDVSKIIHQGMCGGEKLIQEERKAKLSPTTTTTKNNKKT